MSGARSFYDARDAMTAPLLELSTIRIEPSGRLVGAEDAAEDMRGALAEGKVVVLRGLLSAGWAAAIRENAREAMAREPAAASPLRGTVGSAANLTRMEVAAPAEGTSARAFRTRLYFPWNECPSGEVPAALALARLRNVLAERSARLGVEDATTFTVAQVVHYPRGGGFLARHFDHDEGLYCVIIVALSEPGRDFERGGLFVEPQGTRVDVDALLSPGDACLFRPELYHGVDPVDEAGSGPDFGDGRGRWVLNPMFRSLEAAEGPLAAEEEARPAASGELAPSGQQAASEQLAAEGQPAPSSQQPPSARQAISTEQAPSGEQAEAAGQAGDPESALFQDWCRLLGLRGAGQRLGAVEVAAVEEGSASFRIPGCPGAPLRVACRRPGSGPVFRAVGRFGVYYLSDGRGGLSPAEERFLHLLCELTHRRDAARPAPAGQ